MELWPRVIFAKMLRRHLKIFELEGAEDVEAATQGTTLESEGELVMRAISLPESVVAASGDGNVRAYGQTTISAARAVFTEYKKQVRCLARPEEDLVHSGDVDGQVLTWRPSTTELIGSLRADGVNMSFGVAKLDGKRLIIGTGMGNLAIMRHSGGAYLKEDKI